MNEKPVIPSSETHQQHQSSSCNLLYREILALLRYRINYSDQETHRNIIAIAESYRGRGGGSFELSDAESAFLVEALFKFGDLTRADLVSRERATQGHASTAFDRLSTEYKILEQYDFEVLAVNDRRPLFGHAKKRRKLKVLSFYYTTPSFQLNGYAHRSQSILRNTELDVIPYARIGYPWAANLLKNQDGVYRTVHDSVEWNYVRGDIATQTTVFGNLGLAKSAIKELIAFYRPDAIHAASNFTVGLPALLAANECRVPFVYEMRGIWELTAGVGVHGWYSSERYAMERKLETFIAKSAQQVITLTQTQRNELIARGISAEKVSIVANYFDEKIVKSTPTSLKETLRKKLSGYHIIGYAGSIVNYEGLQLLIEMLNSADIAFDKVALLIVGDGPYSANLKKMAEENIAADRIVFTGRLPRSDADELYDLFDVCVLPRLDVHVAQLISPLKLVEILAKGKVLVVSNVAAMAELVEEIGYGELFEASNVADLSLKIKSVLKVLPALKLKYAEAAHFIAENWTWKQGAKHWDRVFEAVCNQDKYLSTSQFNLAADGLRTLSMGGISIKTAGVSLLRRVARIVPPTNVTSLRLRLPLSLSDDIYISIIDKVTGVSVDSASHIEQIKNNEPLVEYIFTDILGKVILFFVPQSSPIPVKISDWQLFLVTSGEVDRPSSIPQDRVDAIGFSLTQPTSQRPKLTLNFESSVPVRFVLTIIPAPNASTGPLFEKAPYSEIIGGRFVYVELKPGFNEIPLPFDAMQPLFIQLCQWSPNNTQTAADISRIRYECFTERPLSYRIALDRKKINVLIAVEVDENLVDGSSIWLRTLAEVVSSSKNCNVYILTKSRLIPSVITANLFSRENVAKIDPVEGRVLSTKDLANHVTIIDGVSGGFDHIIIRGAALARSITSKSIRSRSTFYSVGLVRPDNVVDGMLDDRSATQLMAAFPRLIFQNETTKNYFTASAPAYRGKCYVIPPSVDVGMFVPLDGHPSKHIRKYVAYAGKIIREYGVEELLQGVRALRALRGYADLSVVILGNKFDNNDPEYRAKIAHLIQALGEAAIWLPSVSPQEVAAWLRNARVVWGWRHAEFEVAHFEISTKMIEALAIGVPIILYPSKGAVQLLGDTYAGFAAEYYDAVKAMGRMILTDKRELRRDLRAIGRKFQSRKTYEDFVSIFKIKRKRGKVAIVAHDFRFFEDIETKLLMDNFIVFRQFWKGHATRLDYGEQSSILSADIIHCEWCLGNAVFWSRNKLPNQKLFIRFHRQELMTDFPHDVMWENVDRIVFISPFVMREAQDKFAIPHSKCSYIPISVALRKLDRDQITRPSRRETLGMIGFTPYLKRPDIALELFERLRRKHPRLKLIFKGSLPSKHDWLMRRPEELEKYQEFFAKSSALAAEGFIEFREYDINIQEFYEEIGWVLSTSDIEGCHTAVAEGGTVGCLPLMLNWPGATEVYQAKYVQKDLGALEKYFDTNYAVFDEASVVMQNECIDRFSIENVYNKWFSLYRKYVRK